MISHALFCTDRKLNVGEGGGEILRQGFELCGNYT